MAEIVPFSGETILPEPPEQFLDKAKGWNTVRILAVGVTSAGEVRAGASFSDVAEMIWMLEKVKLDLLSQEEPD